MYKLLETFCNMFPRLPSKEEATEQILAQHPGLTAADLTINQVSSVSTLGAGGAWPTSIPGEVTTTYLEYLPLDISVQIKNLETTETTEVEIVNSADLPTEREAKQQLFEEYGFKPEELELAIDQVYRDGVHTVSFYVVQADEIDPVGVQIKLPPTYFITGGEW